MSNYLNKSVFDITCRQCDRLASFLDEVKAEHPDYYCLPVPPFGDPGASLLIVGLAPGKHGANATGRPFTGDHAGILLYRTLHEFGFSNRPASESSKDGLKLKNCRITNAVKCLPPQNKPVTAEIRRCCSGFLHNELRTLSPGSVVLALGSIAHNAVLWSFELKQKDYPFAHGSLHTLGNNLTMLSSYHCSRYNTQTRRLSEAMFQDIFRTARELLDSK